MHYVYSTLAAPMAYTAYIKNNDKDISVAEKVVHIKGGAGVADNKNLITPRGVVTEISDEDLASLQDNKVFQMHVENGFIVVEKKKMDADKKSDDMNKDDGDSSPVTPDDFEEQKDGTKKFRKGQK